MSKTKKIKVVEDNKEEQPNPMNYPDTPKGDQEYIDDYWGGDIAAQIYHDDMGDR